MDIKFRFASPEEDPHLARILTNAFLPLWNHNWFQGVTSPLDPISTNPDSTALTPLQTRRLALYRGMISVTRMIGGTISVAESETSPSEIAAILLFLPPQCRISILSVPMWKSGMGSAGLGYGLQGVHRLTAYESNVERLFATGLKEYGWKEKDCAFVQMLARNPDYKGEKGAAGALLNWRMEQFWEEEGKGTTGKIPVVLDTSTVQGVKVYERLGFKNIGECKVKTGLNKNGMPPANEEERSEGEEVCKQRVMIKLP